MGDLEVQGQLVVQVLLELLEGQEILGHKVSQVQQDHLVYLVQLVFLEVQVSQAVLVVQGPWEQRDLQAQLEELVPLGLEDPLEAQEQQAQLDPLVELVPQAHVEILDLLA